MTQEEYRDMAQVWNDGFRYNNTHLELNVQEIHKVVSLASISEKIMKQKKKKKLGVLSKNMTEKERIVGVHLL